MGKKRVIEVEVDDEAEELAEREKRWPLLGAAIAGVELLYVILPFWLFFVADRGTALAVSTLMIVFLGFPFLILLIVGWWIRSRYQCGSCRNPIANKNVILCPTCRARFE